MIFVWTFGDVVTIAVVAFVVIVFCIAFLWETIKQACCRHRIAYETRACDAVCSRCGKNLGFIANWRAKQKVGKVS